ncbi:MAG: hypothetical protein WA418_13590 [Bradyrhizobium sp.]
MADNAFDPYVPLSPIGDEIIVENEHVRVWGLKLDPGRAAVASAPSSFWSFH